jgi:hypothetical protein
MHKYLSIAGLCLLTAFVSGCAMGPPPFPAATALTPPEGIPDNSGKYMAPYTSDGVVAEWVDKAVKAKMGSAVGGAIGAYAGQKAMENIPFIGGMLGQKVGEKMGREIAIKGAGGWEFIKSSSDISFNTVDELSVWMYAKYSTNEHYAEVLSATQEIYPEMKQRYFMAIQAAGQAASQAAAPMGQ